MATTLALRLLVIQVCCLCYHLFNFLITFFFVLFCSSFHHHLLTLILSFSSEAHPDVIGADGLATAEGYQSDLAYLKSKVRMHPFY